MDDLNRKKTDIAKPKLCHFKQSHDHALLLLADLIPINTRVTTFKCFIPRNTRLTTFMVRNTRYQVNCLKIDLRLFRHRSPPRGRVLHLWRPQSVHCQPQYYRSTIMVLLLLRSLLLYYCNIVSTPTTLQSVHWSEHIIGFGSLLLPEIEINP